MKAIRRGTKKVKDIIDNAFDVRVYSLDNGFSGTHFHATNDIAQNVLRKRVSDSKIYRIAKGVYMIRVHSNLWFEFQSKID